MPLESLLTRGVLHLRQVLDLLQFLELFVVANVRVVGGQTGQVMHQAQNDQQAGHTRQDEHHFGGLYAVLAERFYLNLVLDFKAFLAQVVREEKV